MRNESQKGVLSWKVVIRLGTEEGDLKQEMYLPFFYDHGYYQRLSMTEFKREDQYSFTKVKDHWEGCMIP